MSGSRRGAIVDIVGGQQAAEQIIAGVVLSERLAVTMYGAIHRAQWNGQRTLRGLVIDEKMLAEHAFRSALVNTKDIATAIALDHPNIVPTIAVESGGPDVVVVTRGVGRYVTVQDLITASQARRTNGGRLDLPVAAAIGKSVVEALAAAHAAGVVHGAVHPRSVLIDEDGAVRLGDFVVGRALTTAVAQGADSSLWRGLAGYLAPEVVVGEDPTPAADVFAVGAMLFTMLSGEVPPGTLHVTPAVERLVQRALDTDLSRRYKHAADLLENLLEAFEDDRWDLADRGEVIRAAGLSATDTNIDDATEDLLASLGSSANSMQVTPMRPSVDSRAEAIAARHNITPTGGSNRLEALLNDLDDSRELTAVDQIGFTKEGAKRDPISELIQMDPRKREAIVQVKPRVPSLDDPDDTPLPLDRRDATEIDPRRSQSSDEVAAMDAIAGLGRAGSRPGSRPSAYARPSSRPQSPTTPQLPSSVGRPGSVAGRASSVDENAAMDAIAGLSRTAGVAEQAAAKLELAAKRAEAAAARVDTSNEEPAAEAKAKSKPRPAATPLAVPPVVDLVALDTGSAPRIKSRLPGIIGLLIIAGLVAGAVYMITHRNDDAEERDAEIRKKREALEAEAAKLKKQHEEEQVDPGSIRVTSDPSQAGVWLHLGKSPVDTIGLASDRMHEIRIDGVDGFAPIDTQVVGAHWSGEGDKRRAHISVDLKKATKATKPLPPMPPKPPDATGFVPGRGPIHVDVNCGTDADKKPCHADVWLYVGMTDQVEISGIPAGRAYEFRVLKKGYKPGTISVTIDEWRDPEGDPKAPIDSAKKLEVLDKSITLEPEGKKKRP